MKGKPGRYAKIMIFIVLGESLKIGDQKLFILVDIFYPKMFSLSPKFHLFSQCNSSIKTIKINFTCGENDFLNCGGVIIIFFLNNQSFTVCCLF